MESATIKGEDQRGWLADESGCLHNYPIRLN